MVRIHAKHGDGSDRNEFLYECSSTSILDEIALELTRISNFQSKINALVQDLEPRLTAPHGNPKAIPLIRALFEAKSYTSKEQVNHGKPVVYNALRNHFQSVEEELMSVSQLLSSSDSDRLQQSLKDLELLKEDRTQILWAGKVLDRNKRLSDYIGTNEKTKIVVKLISHDSCPA